MCEHSSYIGLSFSSFWGSCNFTICHNSRCLSTALVFRAAMLSASVHVLSQAGRQQSLVPKKGKEKYRNITDACVGNCSLQDWGVLYFSARDLADGLTPNAIAFEHDIIEGYHINRLSGCTSELVEGLGLVGARLAYPGDPEYDNGEYDDMQELAAESDDEDAGPALAEGGAHCRRPHRCGRSRIRLIRQPLGRR